MPRVRAQLLLVSLLCECYAADRTCAELIRGLWHSKDLDSSPSSSQADDLGQVSPFSSPAFLTCKMSYASKNGLLPQVKAPVLGSFNHFHQDFSLHFL